MNRAQTDGRFDVLVLGNGVAALQAAIAAARAGAAVGMVGRAKGASPYILGFNVPFQSNGDNPETFHTDTFAGGYELGNSKLIARMASEAEATFAELASYGVPFDSVEGRAALRHLSGSRLPRSVYVRAGTGHAIHAALEREAEKLGVVRHLGYRISRLMTQDGRVVGSLAFDRQGKQVAFQASTTVLALGGIGGLYGDSTYPSDVTGDSYALALEVGATLIDMEFVQFEPTVVTAPERVRGMEMPTAMLGDGATLVNSLGERFMCRYNPGGCERQIEKARMALCIQQEIDEGRGTPDGAVLFDATNLSAECLEGYTIHYKRLLADGLDPKQEAVPVRPAAHSLMGGVKVDDRCASDVPGLFVCGEAAGGLHGASRIAGNGASDAIVMGRVAGRFAAESALGSSDSALASADSVPTKSAWRPSETSASIIESIRETMSANVGLRRSAEGLNTAVKTLQSLHDAHWIDGSSGEDRSASNAIIVALAISRAALMRTESRGAHYRIDHSQTDPGWLRSIEIRADKTGRLTFSSGDNTFRRHA